MSASESPAFAGRLTLGDLLEVSGVDQTDVVVLRHTFTAGGLESAADLTADGVLAYTQWQKIGNKLGRTPPGLWLVFMADGGRRSRLLAAYENHGEIEVRTNEERRRFDLRLSWKRSAPDS